MLVVVQSKRSKQWYQRRVRVSGTILDLKVVEVGGPYFGLVGKTDKGTFELVFKVVDDQFVWVQMRPNEWDGVVAHFSSPVYVSSSSSELFFSSGEVSVAHPLPVLDPLLLNPGSWTPVGIWASPKTSEKGEKILVLLTGSDGSMHLLSTTSAFSQLSLVWSRREGLSRIVESIFVDFPIDKGEAEVLKNEFESSLFQRLAQQGKKLVHSTTSSLMKYLMDVVSGNVFSTSVATVDSSTTNDHFGYRKLILSVTDIGNVFGQHTVQGRMLWSRFYPGVSFKHVALLKKSLDVRFNPESLLFGVDSLGQWWSVTLNPLTGEELVGLRKLSYRPEKFLPLAETFPEEHGDPHSILLIVDSEKHVHVVPSRPESRDVLISIYKKFYFHDFDLEKGEVSGYSLDVIEGEGGFRAVLSWRKIFPTVDAGRGNSEAETPKAEKLLAVSATTNRIGTYSPARVVGGGKQLLWKYLNPHVILIATVREPVADVSGGVRDGDGGGRGGSGTSSGGGGGSGRRGSRSSQEEKGLTIYLVDVVTGWTLTTITHRHASPPFTFLHADNYLIYHYWCEKSHHYLVTVNDFFSPKPGWNRSTFSSRSVDFADTFGRKLKFVQPFTMESQTYAFPVPVSTMALTVTTNGITNPQLLIGLGSHNVLQLDRRLIDSRRPVRPDMKPTDQDMIDGLQPYNPFLDYSHVQFISYNRTVLGLRNIQTAPTQLESTSHAICQGLDLFYTSVTGAKTYDRLDPTFNTRLQHVACVLLGLVTFFGIRYIKQLGLQAAWR
eukprot:TRINITY_DN6764_c0_g1_i11.p1 TRINITY_DN6764_c0_g1~~TRINITY_DN6764_c0_g1_i11.p1  ORF type:complete len:776 (+),score=151.00 TRINITY_DN6764_c0_g1_i11:377-2704(+)